MTYVELLIACTALAVYFVTTLYLKYRNFPPGPWGIPIFGYLPFLKDDYHKQLVSWGSKYGSVFSVNFGMTPVVILNDWNSVNEALNKQSETFSGRPVYFNFEEVLRRLDIVTNDGPVWRAQRRFALHHLRNMGFGKANMENYIMGHVEILSEHMSSLAGKPVKGNGLFYASVLNVPWGIAVGHRFELTDPAIERWKEMLDYDFEAFASGYTLNFLPWFRYIFPSYRRMHNQFCYNSQKVWELLESFADDHIKNFNPGDLKDYADIFIAEGINEKERGTKEPVAIKRNGDISYTAFDREHLVGNLYNFFNAAVETTENTMSWAVLYLSLWPEIQDKVQDELDKAVGRDNLPTWTDRNRLVYAGATLLEVQRMASIVPLSIVHCNTRPTELMGYHLPKETVVFPNLYGVHHDPKKWGDPEIFRPGRFITADGLLVKPDYLIPFGAGSRVCLGEPLARMELYFFFMVMFQRFRFRLQAGHPLPDMHPIVGLTLRPKPYYVIITKR